MSITLIGGEKGGTGKSTLATNLAVWLAHEGRDTVLLDADPQSSSKKWVDRRNERVDTLPVVHVAQATGDALKVARDLATRYQEVVIDAGGRDSRELRTAMVAADVLIVPIRASQVDLETMDHVNELIGLARGLNPTLRAYAMLSLAPSNPMMNEVREAREFLGEFTELELLPVIVRDRVVYRHAILDGRGVVEMSNGQARAEIQLLGQALFDDLTAVQQCESTAVRRDSTTART